MHSKSNVAQGRDRSELWAYRVAWLVCFAVLLPIAVLARLSGWHWKPWPAGATGYKSPLREASIVARSAAAMAFSAS